jgi:methylphosphotriester-DNA--protein-cysteine methyltransferase
MTKCDCDCHARQKNPCFYCHNAHAFEGLKACQRCHQQNGRIEKLEGSLRWSIDSIKKLLANRPVRNLDEVLAQAEARLGDFEGRD